jgi:hypothetical protein
MGLNAKDYATSEGWLKKEDLKRTGPQRLVIASVEERDGKDFGDGKPARKELVLVFEDEQRFSLRAQVNLKRLRRAWGDDCGTWVGRVVEIYYSPDVTNPRGG